MPIYACSSITHALPEAGCQAQFIQARSSSCTMRLHECCCELAARSPPTARFSSHHDAGHGSDEENCAEFCVTSHTFLVNGAEHTVTFREAGTEWGCADRVR